ncbi:hypothetical protein HNQ92_001018 [Rhabdobacter roseus]|uniref:Glycosyltransferase RgtA/B/C/D-like domain-containing protein n=1 Tax=Rhabdobacter roseus TaxID=1655419 RepID=A0A840TMB7_9BACT|nr:hypothetical protein [Rhabdobacter roseus]MBB5282897.1 hypothetical protein [Rhabdobacter roseus]
MNQNFLRTTLIIWHNQLNLGLAIKHWSWWTALFCFANSLFWAFPSYNRIVSKDPQINDYNSFWNRINEQADHPLTHYDYPPAVHEAKISFRLLMPLLARFSPFKDLNIRMAYLFFIQHIAGFFFFLFLIKLAWRYTQDKATSALLAIAISVTYLGHCFFYELFGFFDGVAFTLLLISVYYPRAWWAVLCFFLSFWIDERAVLASGLIFLLLTEPENIFRKEHFKSIFLKAFPFLVAYVVYITIRKGLELKFGLTVPIGTEHDAGLGLIIQQIRTIPLATFLSYEGLWILIIVGIYAAWRKHKRLEVSLYMVAFFIIMLVSWSVWDVTRSLVYGFPVILFCLRQVALSTTKTTLFTLILLVFILNFIIPSYKNHYFQFYWQVPFPVKVLHLFS